MNRYTSKPTLVQGTLPKLIAMHCKTFPITHLTYTGLSYGIIDTLMVERNNCLLLMTTFRAPISLTCYHPTQFGLLLCFNYQSSHELVHLYI